MPGPTIIIRLSSASVRTASWGALVSCTMARPRARPAQPPKAWMSRATMSIVALCASMAAMLPAAYSASPASSSGRRPSASDRGP